MPRAPKQRAAGEVAFDAALDAVNRHSTIGSHDTELARPRAHALIMHAFWRKHRKELLCDWKAILDAINEQLESEGEPRLKSEPGLVSAYARRHSRRG